MKGDGKMRLNRAREIFNSLGIIEVLHQDSPIWIEQIKDEVAEIRYLDTEKRRQVPVAELREPTD